MNSTLQGDWETLLLEYIRTYVGPNSFGQKPCHQQGMHLV
jgi:hypothetical protein